MSNLFQPNKSEQRPSVISESAVNRQAQEVQAAMIVAKKFPRDQYESFNRIMEACRRKSLADNATYEYPRGGTRVMGPSIRLAEALAQNWGNIDFGVIELEQKDGESTVMAYAWDLETNTRQTKIFAVRHERKAKGVINKLNDPRDVYEMVASQGARRLRACILGIIPGDVVDSAIEQCEKTIIEGEKEPLKDRVRKMLDAFKQRYGVSKEMVEKLIGCNVEAFTEKDMLRLRSIFSSLKDGMAKREDYFNVGFTEEIKENANKETLDIPTEEEKEDTEETKEVKNEERVESQETQQEKEEDDGIQKDTSEEQQVDKSSENETDLFEGPGF